MKILIFYEQYTFGGVDNHLKTLINNWPNKEDSFFILTNFENNGFDKIKKKILYKNFNFKKIKFFSINKFYTKFLLKKKLIKFKYFFYLIYPLIFLFSLINAYFLTKKYLKYDIFLTNNGGYPASWFSIFLSIFAGYFKFKKNIMLIHHCGVKDGFLFKYFGKFFDYLLSKNITDLITVSKATLNSLKLNRNFKFDKFKTNVILNDIVIPKKIKISKKIKKIKNKNPQKKIFGIVSRVERNKGHHVLLDAYKKLQKKNRNKIVIVFIGIFEDDEYFKFLNNKIKNLKSSNIYFVGYVGDTSLSIIKTLDCLIMCTIDFEGFGLTILEALKVGTPIITTDVGAVKEFVDEKYSLVVKPNDVKSVSKAIIRVSNNYERIKNKSLNYKKFLCRIKKYKMSENYRGVFDAKSI